MFGPRVIVSAAVMMFIVVSMIVMIIVSAVRSVNLLNRRLVAVRGYVALKEKYDRHAQRRRQPEPAPDVLGRFRQQMEQGRAQKRPRREAQINLELSVPRSKPQRNSRTGQRQQRHHNGISHSIPFRPSATFMSPAAV